jgi:hypothetical protein
MRTRRLTFWIGVSVLAAMAAASACGGGKDVAKENRGAAGTAAGQYFIQEAAGGKLPEGTNVADRGTDDIVVLPLTADDKQQSVKARYCVAYRYVDLGPGTPNRTRVYIAKLLKDGGWSVEAVKPDGNCDGVQ